MTIGKNPSSSKISSAGRVYFFNSCFIRLAACDSGQCIDNGGGEQDGVSLEAGGLTESGGQMGFTQTHPA